MISSRSANFFNRLAKHSTEEFSFKENQTWRIGTIKGLTTHKAELDRVYKLIEHSAKGGGIRVFIPRGDPIWDNSFVLNELSHQGFEVLKNQYSTSGSIEWWHVPEDKKKELF